MSADLELFALSHTHPGATRAAVDAVTARVPAGHMVAVVGPSGSGKTTLLRLIAGLATPDTGGVRVAGRNVSDVPPERRGMAMMFQKPHLFAHLDVRDNVAFADRVKGVPRRRARETAARFLDLVQLGALGGRRTRQLSGGQEQRVALARALAAGPEILLLDEPFSALDTALRAEMHSLLIEVRAALGPTIVMVTHDMAEAALADSVAVLIGGELVQHATLDELYRRPASVAVARLLGGFSEVRGILGPDGHESALGMIKVDDASMPGAAGHESLLLLRQESVHLVSTQDPEAVVTGVVVGSSRSGARHVAEVEVGTGRQPRVRVRSELPLGHQPGIGRQVGVRIHGSGVVVPVPQGSTLEEPRTGIAPVDVHTLGLSGVVPERVMEEPVATS